MIREEGLSPRKLIARSRVAYIGTTDDIADPLDVHEKLRADGSFPVQVAPTFRLDAALLLNREGYAGYIDRLEKAAGLRIEGLEDLQAALIKRLDDFCRCGCRFADVGIPFFPDGTRDTAAAQRLSAPPVGAEPPGCAAMPLSCGRCTPSSAAS